jgi:phytoene desaturase
MQPGGRAYVTGRTASPSTPAPRSSPRPSCSKSCGRCAASLADDVDLRPVAPFYRIRFDDGSHFDYSGDPETMRREVARFAPADVDGYERFMRASEAIFRRRLRAAGRHVPFVFRLDRHAEDRARPDAAAELPHGVRAGGQLCEERALRMVLSFHPLLIGGNPFTTTSICA